MQPVERVEKHKKTIIHKKEVEHVFNFSKGHNRHFKKVKYPIYYCEIPDTILFGIKL